MSRAAGRRPDADSAPARDRSDRGGYRRRARPRRPGGRGGQEHRRGDQRRRRGASPRRKRTIRRVAVRRRRRGRARSAVRPPRRNFFFASARDLDPRAVDASGIRPRGPARCGVVVRRRAAQSAARHARGVRRDLRVPARLDAPHRAQRVRFARQKTRRRFLVRGVRLRVYPGSHGRGRARARVEGRLPRRRRAGPGVPVPGACARRGDARGGARAR